MKRLTLALCTLLSILLFFAACTPKKTGFPLNEGRWRANMTLDVGALLPFNFDLYHNDGKPYIEIINGAERIRVDSIVAQGDSVIFSMPYYNSAIIGQVNEKRIHGYWYNYAKGDDYRIHFYAVHNDSSRFFVPTIDSIADVSGRWAAMFMTDDRKSKTDAVAEIEQDSVYITGTFMTPTGDYRYLAGNVTNDEFFLSCFDGAHAFLFEGSINPDGDITGDFWSGKHWHETWFAYKDDTVTLPNPEKLTFLKDGYDKFAFSFPNLEGEQVSLTDEKYKGKVVMAQIMGSWCPNCRDESALLTDIYKQYRGKGLEIIALAYENSDDMATAKPLLERYKQQIGIDYEMLLAGKASKTTAAESLPMLNDVQSFPTTIFIDRTGKVRKIHTGFSGPATSQYEDYVKELHSFLEQLLKEEEV